MDPSRGEVAELDAELDAALDSARWIGDSTLLQTPRRGFDDGEGMELDGLLDDGSGNEDDSVLPGEGGSLLDSSRLLRDGAAGGVGDDSIRVFVRMRPPNQREGAERRHQTVLVDSASSSVQLLVEPPRVFTFDGVLGESSTQDEVFQLVGTSVGEACLNGYNGSVYVYGQTGSGKTHTMQGPVNSVQAMRHDERRGVMCRMLDLIFSQVSKRHSEGFNVEYRCKCSYLEIYKEQITDLLEPGSSNNLQVREDINRGVYVERLSEHTVWTLSDALHVLWKGLHQRHVGATQMNELSSRSHAVFTLVIEATSTAPGGVTSTRTARLNLVDLAGSERQPSSDQAGPPGSRTVGSLRVKEAGAINKSLSALTNVIMSLSRAAQRRKSLGGQRRPFVRYRDSKLTFLLRDSLGGNSKTVMVACVSPAALCFGETLSTLKFAQRAKTIKCTAVLNEEYSGSVESLMLEVRSLRAQLELLSSRGLLQGVQRSASQYGGFGRGSVAQLKTTKEEEEEEDPLSSLEGLTEAAGEDLRRIYGQRRVRRLEILLATALERERRCELKKHKLDKFSQYLNGLLERKENYFDALREYFTLLVDQAVTSSCLPLEVTRKLIAFRQQLCSVPTDGRAISTDSGLDGMLGARVSASVGDLGAARSSQRGLVAAEMSTPRSRSFGILIGQGMPQRQRQLAYGGGGAFREDAAALSAATVRGGSAFQASSASSASGVAGDVPGGEVILVPDDEILASLRSENRLLRRQLENHPELHRLAVENRLLRQHLASLVQERAFAGDEPRRSEALSNERHNTRKRSDGWKGRGSNKEHKQQHQNVPDDEGQAPRGSMPRPRSLTRTSRSSILGLPGEVGAEPLRTSPISAAASGFLDQSGSTESPNKSLAMRPFPGCEDATQISPSSSSADSGADLSDQDVPPYTGIPGRRSHGGSRQTTSAVDATSFLPAMAREVEELLRVKSGLEATISHLLHPGSGGAMLGGGHESLASLPSSPLRRDGSMAAIVEVESKVASEFLHHATEALSFAEGILAKGKGETLLLSAGPRPHESDAPGDEASTVRATAEGLDERDVFLSLMRSLPPEATSLSRQGAASSAPHLSHHTTGGSSALSNHRGMQGGDRHTASAATVLRPSSSMSSASTRLLRNRSTVQLYRIVESPFSPRTNASGGAGTLDSSLSDESPASHHAMNRSLAQKTLEPPVLPTTPGEMLREAMAKMKQLYGQLELVSDAYRDVREQFKPLQEEYQRKHDECRTLESHCRRLDMQSRLLEEQATAAEAARPKLSASILPDSAIKFALGASGVGGSLRLMSGSSSTGSQSSASLCKS